MQDGSEQTENCQEDQSGYVDYENEGPGICRQMGLAHVATVAS